jgi:hypothetical protein
MAPGTVTLFSYVATPEKYRVASSSVQDRSVSIVIGSTRWSEGHLPARADVERRR